MANASLFVETTRSPVDAWQVTDEVEQVYRRVLRPVLARASEVHLFGQPENFRLDEDEDDTIVVRKGARVQLDVRKDLVTNRPNLWNAHHAGSIAIVFEMESRDLLGILSLCPNVGTMSLRQQKKAFSGRALSFADEVSKRDDRALVLVTSSSNAIQFFMLYGEETRLDGLLDAIAG